MRTLVVVVTKARGLMVFTVEQTAKVLVTSAMEQQCSL